MWPEPPSPAAMDAAIRRGHQEDGVREKRVATVVIGLAVALPLILVCLWLQYKTMARSRYRGLTAPTLIAPQSQPQHVMPEPRLIIVSGADLTQLRAQEDAELNTYGWIDRPSNIVRIPIQRAMELIAQRGLPVRGSNHNNTGASEYDLLIQRSRQRQEAPIKEAK